MFLHTKSRAIHPRLRPPTASPAPSTSLSSPSNLRVRGTGLIIGLDKPIDARNVGLDVMFIERGYDPDIVGEDVAELTVDPGIEIGIAMGILLLPRGEPTVECGSRRWGIEGETARRFEAGYGSKRSSTTESFMTNVVKI